MITPAYSPTATERVLPRLALDFTTGVLDPRVTVTRALNTATRVNSSGYIEVVNANLPRFDYNPTTLAPRGLLIEESRTNQLQQSQAFGTSPWTVSAATISADQVISPDGSQNADLLYPSSTGAGREVYQAAGYTGGVTYTISIYVKAAGMSWVTLGAAAGSAGASRLAFFNVSTGTVGTTGASVSNPSITSVGNGWYRLSLNYTPAGAGGYVEISVVDGDNNYTATKVGTNGVYLYGAQLEAGAFATSYIPTTTTSATRNADEVKMTGTNFSSWWNASEGTMALWQDNATSGYRTGLQVDDGTNNNRILIQSGSPPTLQQYYVVVGGSPVVSTAAQALVSAGSRTVASYKLNNYAYAVNGAVPTTDTSATVPTVTQIFFGVERVANFLNGHIQKFMYWPQWLTNAEVRAFSK